MNCTVRRRHGGVPEFVMVEGGVGGGWVKGAMC